MTESIIEIRSNINSSFVEIERLTKEREEREKAERDAKWKREEEERKKKLEDWKLEHPNMDKYTYASYYNYSTFNFDFGTYCNINFYEWSDITREPIKFKHYPELYDFLDKCGLLLSNDDNNMIKPLASCHISCKPGSKDLFVCTTYGELQRKMHEAENLANILAPVPEVHNDEEEVKAKTPKVLSCTYYPTINGPGINIPVKQ